MQTPDWQPGLYTRFADARLQPALDLMARIGPLPEGDVIDLGCGAGAASGDLRARFCSEGERRLVGVDSSASMLEQARGLGTYDRLDQADVALWSPHGPVALIFSNALLHWLPDHAALLPRLAGEVAPGGTLAVQVPHQNPAPSHRLWHSLVEAHYPGRFEPAGAPGILDPVDYHRILSPLGRLDLWQTEYFQQLPAADDGHPVRLFTQSTFARPVLASLREDEAAALCRIYDAEIAAHYPLAPDGTVLFPFRRLFFTLYIG
ncbi:methyltransferase domain-containing protein [Seohaeicola saemankumensis]|nr:methyltransferase domain-containing protein [Seohaeicola saemankumensis]MCA0873171.1 methyltransferase domain-containing protein [Seohaeicola saemankumensis]